MRAEGNITEDVMGFVMILVDDLREATTFEYQDDALAVAGAAAATFDRGSRMFVEAIRLEEPEFKGFGKKWAAHVKLTQDEDDPDSSYWIGPKYWIRVETTPSLRVKRGDETDGCIRTPVG